LPAPVRRAAAGRHARESAAVDFRAAPRIQLLHAGRRRHTDVNFNTYIFLPSVERAPKKFKVADRRLLRRVRARGEQVNVVTKSGTNSLHGTIFEFNRNDGFDSSRTRSPQPQRRREGALQWNQYGYTAWRTCLEEQAVLHVEFRRVQGSQTVPESIHRSDRRNAEGRLLAAPRGWGRRSSDTDGARRQRRRRSESVRKYQLVPRNASRFANNTIPTSRLDPIALKLLEFYPEPNTVGTGRPWNNE